MFIRVPFRKELPGHVCCSRRLALTLVLLTPLYGLAQDTKKPEAKAAPAKKIVIKEELILKNGDRLTGELLNSTGTEIKFKSDLAGEVTVAWDSITELKSDRVFAVIPKDIKDSRNSKLVPQGAIKISEKAVVISPPAAKPEARDDRKQEQAQAEAATATPVAKEVPASKIGFIVDDASYLKEIHRKIGFRSGWDGHIDTGSTTILSTQSSYLLAIAVGLKRSVPTVSWLDPRVRTTFDFNMSVGKTTQVGDPDTITNVFHVGAERDDYFSRKGYFLQSISFDHNFSQGLVLQQIYGSGVGVTLDKTATHEFDMTADLHYEGQHFNATANVEELNLHLFGSTLTEAYEHKWGKIHFDEKLAANIAWNNANAFSATGTTSVRMPVYKKLGFSVSIIDNFLNNPQVGYQKNTFQFTTGFAFSLH